jgi:hypothetical protein
LVWASEHSTQIAANLPYSQQLNIHAPFNGHECCFQLDVQTGRGIE